MKKPLALCLLALTTHVIAQDTVDTLDTIEVTSVRGNKDERTFLESNESISVLKPKSLNRADLDNSIQMLNGLSNIQTSRNGENFSIRGISDKGATGFQKDNLASILVDDLFQTSLAIKAGSFENWDLNSIEVYRGAQSTSQGVNSLAGNILLYHKQASFEDEGAAKLALGTFGRKEGALLLNKTVINGKFAIRGAYNKEITDGYIQNAATNNDRWGARNKDHFDTNLYYKLGTKDDLYLDIKLLRMNQGGSYVQGDDFKDFKVTEDKDYKSITNNQQTGLTYLKTIDSNFSNKFLLGYSQGDSFTKSDGDGTRNNTAGTRREDERDSFMSLENQFKYKNDKVKNVLGIHLHRYTFYNNNDFKLLYDNPAPVVTFAIPVVQEDTRHRNTYALFDSLLYDLDKHHSVELGLRLEVVKNDSETNIRAASIGNATVDNFFNTREGKFDQDADNTIALPKIGYHYKNNNYSLGAFYNQGYRTGGLSVNRARGKVVTYDPERTHNYELSYKYMESRFLLSSNVFYTKWKKQQVDIKRTTAFYDNQVENIADSELYGAEVEGSYEFKNADSFRLNIGYVETQFLNFKTLDASGDQRSYAGNAFPDAAKYNAQASYWKFITEDLKSILTLRYVGKSYSDAENIRKSPEQYYADFNTQYTFGNYIAELYVRNIFNRKYRIYNGTPRTTAPSYQVSYHRVSPPTEFGARLNYYW